MITEAPSALAASAQRGSTHEERAAAKTWCETNLHARLRLVDRPRRSTKTASKRPGRPNSGSRPAVVPLPSSPIAQLDALERQQQRILHGKTLTEYVLAAEQRTGAGLTLGDALAELVRDINGATRTIGTTMRPHR